MNKERENERERLKGIGIERERESVEGNKMVTQIITQKGYLDYYENTLCVL